ncbi:hypothetical protein [Azospirillum sp. sgz302134]
MHMSAHHGSRLHCACCARPFARTSHRGPAPLYCSTDCRAQMRIRQRVWNGRAAANGNAANVPANANAEGAAYSMALAS